jgi:hypothetical protein
MPREEGASELRNSKGHLLKVGVPGNELAGCYASYWRMSIDYVIDEEGVAQTPITRNKPTSISAYALIQGTAGSASEAFTPSIKMEIQPRQNMHKQSTEQRSSKVLRWQSFPRGISPHDNAMSSYCGELMPPRSPFSLAPLVINDLDGFPWSVNWPHPDANGFLSFSLAGCSRQPKVPSCSSNGPNHEVANNQHPVIPPQSSQSKSASLVNQILSGAVTTAATRRAHCQFFSLGIVFNVKASS